jgi:5-methylcytosine-specific restriction endonuclease McrA
MPPPKSERGIEQVWRDLYDRHMERKCGFHLTLSELMVITQLPCSYCGKVPSNVYHLTYKTGGKNHVDTSKEIRCSGIDRVDSSKPYVHGNVVPCCWVCNRMKGPMPLDKFLGAVRRIRKHHSSSEKVLHQAASVFGE